MIFLPTPYSNEFLWILTPLPWVSESFRQDIGQFLGPCKLGDYFISNKYIYYDKFDRFA